jgi:hypothetical protein
MLNPLGSIHEVKTNRSYSFSLSRVNTVYCVDTYVELLIVSYAEIITGWSIPANKKTPFRILSSCEHHLLDGQI